MKLGALLLALLAVAVGAETPFTELRGYLGKGREYEWLTTVRAGGFCESLLSLQNRTGPWPNEPSFKGKRPGKNEKASVVTSWFIAVLGFYELLLFQHPSPAVR